MTTFEDAEAAWEKFKPTKVSISPLDKRLHVYQIEKIVYDNLTSDEAKECADSLQEIQDCLHQCDNDDWDVKKLMSNCTRHQAYLCYHKGDIDGTITKSTEAIQFAVNDTQKEYAHALRAKAYIRKRDGNACLDELQVADIYSHDNLVESLLATVELMSADDTTATE